MKHSNPNNNPGSYFSSLRLSTSTISEKSISLATTTTMATTMAGVSLSSPRALSKATESPKVHAIKSSWLNNPWKRSSQFGSAAGRMLIRPVYAAPDKISEKVEESIKNAEEACGENPASGECVAAWDEVEELSAAASHARDKMKDSDPLETYCKDNPETDECRTYED